MTAFWLVAIFLLQSQVTGQVQPGAVTGRLLSPNGMPASGIRIAAVPVLEGDDKTSAPVLFGISQTDSDGRYRLENIPPGRYYIFAGLIDLPSYYPSATSLDRATAVVIDSGATLSGIDFSMARPVGLTVSGHLAIPSRMKLGGNGTAVTLTPLTRTATSPARSRVAPDGSFEFLRVPPGDYRLSSNLLGSVPMILRVTEADVLDLALPVVDCEAGALVSGRLVGTSPMAIRTISLSGSRAGCTHQTAIAPDGSFTFRNVPEGAYQVQLTPAPLGWNPVSLTVEKTDRVGMEIPLPVTFAIKGSANVEDSSALPRGTRGSPLAILALRNNGGEALAPIHDDGTFELLLPKGRYRISAPGIPAGYYVKAMMSGFTDLSTTFLDVGDESPSDIQLTLGFVTRPEPRGVRLTGHVSFAPAGTLLKAESVLLVSASGSRNAVTHQSAIAPDGSFEFTGVPPGVYNLEAFPDNPAALYGIVVDKTDVTGIEFSLPVLVKVRGGIEWADSKGSTVPAARTSVSVQFTRKEGTRMLAWGALAQSGFFYFYLPEGDYRFSVSDLPADFNLDSATVDDANILETGLRVRAGADPPNLRVTLRGKY